LKQCGIGAIFSHALVETTVKWRILRLLSQFHFGASTDETTTITAATTAAATTAATTTMKLGMGLAAKIPGRRPEDLMFF
jgi:hypothetical protein